MTENAVADPSELPRDADFRATYARSSQGSLFGESNPPAPDAPLYVMITYGPSNATEPHFASIIVPDPECSQILARIRLDDILLEVKREVAGTGRVSFAPPAVFAPAARAVAEELVEDALVLSLKGESLSLTGAVASTGIQEASHHEMIDDFDSAQPDKEEQTANIQLSLFSWAQEKEKSGNDNDGN